MTIDWKSYDPGEFYDELISTPGYARAPARNLTAWLRSQSDEDLQARKLDAELAIIDKGVTFTVYSDGENIDRAWPFDIIPRVMPIREWRNIEAGLKQRLQALNLFIDDLYHEQKIIGDGVIPASLIAESKGFRKECIGIKPAHQVWAHICGSDLVRDSDGTVYVLEDNLRVPSGVSYMIENREVTKRILPELFENNTIMPVDNYPDKLLEMLLSISPSRRKHPEVAVLTPGIYNSAYFEHAFLARSMGAELVEGADLMVDKDDYVYMKTINGLARVDVIYRRIDDLFLDPEVFLPESALGVPGLMRAWRKGNVALANAPGCGVADDKVVYSYVPDIIRYYLDEDALLPNVPTYRCNDAKEREHVLANLASMVVKPANESGGYGMLVGPQSTAREREEFRRLISSNPRNYIGQPALRLSTAPTLCDHTVEPRHLDLRPFILQGAETYVTAGGLTRVAMKSGSLVVNSSQGGGSKDTWIVDNEGG
ncbi:MAG: circularly permuted type 2 ATP-grasp protein [Gammaproteobacteria bacterium]